MVVKSRRMVSTCALPESLINLDASLMLPHVTHRLLQTGSSGALADAQTYLCSCLRSDGEAHGEDWDFYRQEREWAAFIDWCRDGGRVLPLDFPGPAREGGREHDVTLDDATGRWVKYTKRSASGYTVNWTENGTPFLLNASPSEYLQRLLWQNFIFGDDIHLVGLWEEHPRQWRIITTQPGLQGEPATLDEIEAAFVSAGFSLLPWRSVGYEGSLSLRFEGYDIWDVHPANVLLSPEHLPLPIDVIVTRTPV